MSNSNINLKALRDGKAETISFESLLSALSGIHLDEQLVYNGTLKEYLVSVWNKMFKGETIDDVSFVKLDLVKCHVRNVIFKNCIFEQTALDGCDLREVRFIDCTFTDCFFKETDYSKCQFDNVTYVDCKHFQSAYTKCIIRNFTLQGGTAETFLYHLCEFQNFKVIDVKNEFPPKNKIAPPALFREKKPDKDTIEALSRLEIAIEIRKP